MDFAENVILLTASQKSDYLNAPFVWLTPGQTNFFECNFFAMTQVKKD